MNEYYECGDGWISLIEEAKTIIAKYNCTNATTDFFTLSDDNNNKVHSFSK